MNNTFQKIIHKYIDNEHLVNKMIVTLFVEANGLEVTQNELIKSHLMDAKDIHYLEIAALTPTFSFEQLIEAFEVAIPAKNQQINGAVYTPKPIKDYITQTSIDELNKPLNEILSADISCGCGAFLYSLAIHIHENTGKSIESILQEQIFGLDINESSIQRAKILLSLLAISKGSDLSNFSVNLFVGNALEFNWNTLQNVKENDGFDLIVGNPPYVRAKHIDKASKDLLKNWQVTKSGNPDLYIPFFEIGLKNINRDGVLGYITVNSFFRTVNARSLRTYFTAHQTNLKIINFGHEQIFANKLAYTCICFLKKIKSDTIQYTKSTLAELPDISNENFTTIAYHSLNAHRGWLLNNSLSINNIKKIESCGTPLGKLYPIKNGIATLSNDIYIFKPTKEDEKYFYIEKNGREYPVEKTICRDIIKPNILKYEHQISEIKEQLIYPYTNGIAPLSLIKEAVFEEKFPMAYHYLQSCKDRLDQRDKGNGDYAAWYAFGRTQALTDTGLRLLFPYMAKQPYFVFTDNKDMLIYCGYAIFSDSKKELLVLKKLLESEVFDYYMQNTSKPYASGYYSYAKNYVKHFGICELSDSEKEEVLGLESKGEVDEFFMEKYELVLHP